MKITTDDLIRLSFRYRDGAAIAWTVAGEWTLEEYKYAIDWDGLCLDDVCYPLFLNLLRQGKWK